MLIKWINKTFLYFSRAFDTIIAYPKPRHPIVRRIMKCSCNFKDSSIYMGFLTQGSFEIESIHPLEASSQFNPWMDTLYEVNISISEVVSVIFLVHKQE